MKALIDGDVLRYEIGHSAQYTEVNEKTGDPFTIVREWDFCQQLFDDKIKLILEDTEADDHTIYLTNDEITNRIWNRRNKTYGLNYNVELIPNYRHAIATVKDYKSTRGKPKPVHYNNLTSYILNEHDWRIANGAEADDLMAQDQTETTIICSRDKDLRQVPGNHYAWECGVQKAIGPITFDKKGWIEEPSKGKVFGGGEMFFLYQLLVGDIVDTVPGCPKVGHVGAMRLLDHSKGRRELYDIVKGEYQKIYNDDWRVAVEEQGQLLWLQREPNQMWRWPYD